MDIRAFLARLRVESGPNDKGEYMCRCPAHDDKNASLCVRDGEKGIVLKCQAGCDTRSVVAAMGLKLRDLFRDQDSAQHATPAPVAKQARQHGNSGDEKRARGVFVCAYPYTDEQGKVLFEVCRYQRPDGSKTFNLRQPDPNNPNGYKWTKDGARLVLYRLPAVLKAIKESRPVFVCEGEKDCDTMAKMGYAATTNPMGAGKWHVADYASSLAGADLYIIPDNDDVGRDHAQRVARSAVSAARSIHIIDLTVGCSQLPPKGDTTDFFHLLGEEAGRATLEKLMQTAAPYELDADAQREEAAAYYGKVYGYCISHGRICQETADGPRPLANFVAVPRAVVAQDDGVNVNKIMVIDGWDAQGHTVVVLSNGSKAEATSAEEASRTILKRGMKGEDVRRLQLRLMELGYGLPRYGADGEYGAETAAAVKAFQADRRLAADGVAGEMTLAALYAGMENTYTVVLRGVPEAKAIALISLYDGEIQGAVG